MFYRLALCFVLLFAPVSMAADVDDLLKDITKQQKLVKKLSKKDPTRAGQASEKLDGMRKEASREIGAVGTQRLNEDFDVAGARKLLERAREMGIDGSEIGELERSIQKLEDKVISGHENGVETYTRLDEQGNPSSRAGEWLRLHDQYRELANYAELNKEINKYAKKIGKVAFPLLVSQGDTNMDAEEYVKAVESYQKATDIKPKDKELAPKLQRAKDYKKANELGLEAKNLLEADKRNFRDCIDLYERALGLHPDYKPLMDGLEIARQRGTEVLMEDAQKQYGDNEFIRAVRTLESAKRLHSSHEPTREALRVMDGNYRETVGTRLIARGDTYAADGFNGQAYVEYMLAGKISSRVSAKAKADAALAGAKALVPYVLQVGTPSLGAAEGFGDVHTSFQYGLKSKLSQSSIPRKHNTRIVYDDSERDASFGGNFAAFRVERSQKTTERTKSYISNRYQVPNPDYEVASNRETEAQASMEEARISMEASKQEALDRQNRCLEDPPEFPIVDAMGSYGGCTGAGTQLCYCYGKNWSSSGYDQRRGWYEDAKRDRENTPTEVTKEDTADHTYEVIWHYATPTAALDMEVYVGLIKDRATSRASYTNSYKDYTVARQVIGVDDEVLENEHQASLPSNDQFKRDMLDSLIEQGEKFVLAHVSEHGERWRVAYEQKDAGWQKAHGTEYLVVTLLSKPSISHETKGWASQKLEDTTGYDWSSGRAVLTSIPPVGQ